MADVPSQKDFRAMIESLPPSKLDIDDVMRRGRRYRLLSRMGAALSIASVAIIVASAGILIAGKDAERLVDEGAPQGQRGVPPTSDEGSGPSSPLARGFPVWSDLPPLDQPTDTRLYLSDGPRLTVVDVDAADAKTHRLAALGGGGHLLHPLVRRGDVLAFHGRTGDYDEPDTLVPAIFTMDPDTSLDPDLLAEGWFFIPSGHEDRVWIATLDETSPATVRALAFVREVATDGTVTVGDVHPPDGRWPIAAVLDGLIFQDDDDLELWDPATQAFVRSFQGPFPVATWSNRLVSTDEEGGELHLIDLDTNTERAVNVPGGWGSFAGYDGAFSPDGRWVAVSVLGESGRGVGPGVVMGVALVDFEDGTVQVIPGSQRVRTHAEHIVWSSDGEWVFVNVADEVIAYHPGNEGAKRVPVILDPNPAYDRYFRMAAS